MSFYKYNIHILIPENSLSELWNKAGLGKKQIENSSVQSTTYQGTLEVIN